MKLNKIIDRIAREPVLIGAAVTAQFEATWPSASPAAKLALGAWVAIVVRAFSTSKRTADENIEVAQWVGAVEEAAKVPPSVKRTR